MANNISQWFTSDSANNTGSAPNYPVEGQSPSSVNDTMRTIYGAVARWYQDMNGTLTSGGSSNAYTLATNNAHTALSDLSLIVFKANHANTGSATLNVDGLGAKPIRFGGASLSAGVIAANSIVIVGYNATNDVFDLFASPAAMALKNATGTFTATQTWQDNAEVRLGTGGDLRLYHNGTNSFIDNDTGGLVITSVGNITINGVNVTDYARKSQTVTLTGNSTSADSATLRLQANEPWLVFYDTNGVANARTWRVRCGSDRFLAEVGSDAGVFEEWLHIVAFNGAITTVNIPNGTLQYGGLEVGTMGIPRDSRTADFTVTAAMRGRMQVCSGAADDITVQASGAPSAGEVVFIENNTGGSIDIIQGSGMTITLDGTNLTGSRTLAANGTGYIYFTSSSTAKFGGLGAA